jgi:hypothetical protein
LANNGKFGRSAAFLPGSQDYHVVLVGLFTAALVPDGILGGIVIA